MTRIFIETEFGTAEYPDRKALLKALRLAGLKVKALRFVNEVAWGDDLHQVYSYSPTSFRYKAEAAEALYDGGTQ